MKAFRLCKIILAATVLVLAVAAISIADTSVYKCQEEAGCIDTRVNFGAVEIKCTDVNGDILADWVCEYELEYSCKNTLTGETRTGGFEPESNSLCEKLCGPCKNGWNKLGTN